jgi:hypothetical protein
MASEQETQALKPCPFCRKSVEPRTSPGCATLVHHPPYDYRCPLAGKVYVKDAWNERAQEPEAIMSDDVLVRQLTGRASFLERRGEVKSPSLMREAAARLAQAIETRRAETTGSVHESAVGETDASDAALLADICDNMAEVLKPLPGEE